MVDVAGFGDLRRTNLHQVAVREGLYRLLTLAFTRSGIAWSDCDHEDRGDGVLVMVPADVPKSAFAESLPQELVAALKAHNDGRRVEEQIRLRMALHAGEIHYDEHGVVGRAVNLAFRLLDAQVLKDALAASSGLLAMITSSWFFDEVIWHSRTVDRATYHRVSVTVKETDAVAWICLPDSVGLPSLPAPHAETPAAPHQLPANTRQFVGREQELRELMGLLDGARRTGTVVITALDGSAGIGKTTLALHWAHRVKDEFPDGQLHVNLRGFDPREPMDAGQALHGFLQALGVDANAIPVDLDSRAALYRSLLAERRMLIVLDNARSSDHVRPLLPASASCVVLITSRRRLDGLTVREGAYRIALDVLSRVDAMALLAARVGARRLEAEPAAAAELIELCARLPLALSIAAARAAGQPGLPLSALVGELRDERHRLDVLDLGDTDLSLRAVFSWSITVLSPAAAKLFRLLGVHPGPDIDLYACGALAGTTSRARELLNELNELTGAHLIAEYVPGRFRFHDLLRAYATEQSAQDEYAGERAEAAETILKFYLHLALLADRIIQPCRDGVVRDAEDEIRFDAPEFTTYRDGIAWFAEETGTLLALVTFAADHGFATYAWQLAWACTTFLRRTSRWNERVMVHRTALAATRRSGDRMGEATALRHLAPAIARLGHHDEALGYLREAAEIFASLDDDKGAVSAHLSWVRVFEAQQNHVKALDHARQAWRLVRDGDDLLALGSALTAMGKQLSLLGRQAEALPLSVEALGYYSTLGHPEGEADVLLNIGEIEQRLGHHEQALSRYQRSLDIDRSLGDRYWEAVALDHLGDALLATDDRPSAEYAWRQSLAIFIEVRRLEADRVRAKLSALVAKKVAPEQPRPPGW